MGWDRVMIYIPEDGKVKMAKDAPGVLEKLIPNATMVESGLLAETPYRMIRQKTKGRGKEKQAGHSGERQKRQGRSAHHQRNRR